MPYESGGRADKQGNEYESMWRINWLLRLANEEISSLVVEGLALRFGIQSAPFATNLFVLHTILQKQRGVDNKRITFRPAEGIYCIGCI